MFTIHLTIFVLSHQPSLISFYLCSPESFYLYLTHHLVFLAILLLFHSVDLHNLRASSSAYLTFILSRVFFWSSSRFEFIHFRYFRL